MPYCDLTAETARSKTKVWLGCGGGGRWCDGLSESDASDSEGYFLDSHGKEKDKPNPIARLIIEYTEL